MRIALVSTSSGPVRPDNTGSVESQVWLLARELAARDHEVTVFGCGGSETLCEFVAVHAGPYATAGTLSDWQLCDWLTLTEAVTESHRFDIIHSHAYLWGLPLARFSTAPMVHTMHTCPYSKHTCPYSNEALLWDRFPDANIVGLSSFQWKEATTRQPRAIIPNGIDPADFAFGDSPGESLCYLGRFIAGKGPLEAIAAAREVGLPLILAGPANDYFEEHIRPHVDGQHIRYIGPVNREQRSELLRSVRALLYPLREPEPFGLVQVEAMMCGTPVVATSIGAVPEIVEHGRTGLLVETPASLAAAIARIHTLDRAAIRARAEQRFAIAQTAMAYEALYAAICRDHVR